MPDQVDAAMKAMQRAAGEPTREPPRPTPARRICWPVIRPSCRPATQAMARPPAPFSCTKWQSSGAEATLARQAPGGCLSGRSPARRSALTRFAGSGGCTWVSLHHPGPRGPGRAQTGPIVASMTQTRPRLTTQRHQHVTGGRRTTTRPTRRRRTTTRPTRRRRTTTRPTRGSGPPPARPAGGATITRPTGGSAQRPGARAPPARPG